MAMIFKFAIHGRVKEHHIPFHFETIHNLNFKPPITQFLPFFHLISLQKRKKDQLVLQKNMNRSK